MIGLPPFRSPSHRPLRRHTLGGDRRKPGFEQLERRELLDAGFASTTGLANSASLQLVTSLYEDLLNRAPQPSETVPWQSALTAGKSLSDLARSFLSSPEYQSDFITDSYTTFLKRLPQPHEVNSWLQATQAGLSEERLLANFLGSAEYYQDQGGTPEGWITGLYRDLLNRTPDAASFFLWRQELQSGTSRETVALGFVASQEEDMRFVTASYQQLLGRDPDAAGATTWVSGLQNGMLRTDVLAGIIGSSEFAQDQVSAAPAATSSSAGSESTLHFDFGPTHSPAASGTTRIAFVPYSTQQGYGWQSVPGLGVTDRNTSDPNTRAFIFGTDATFQVDLPNGSYTVTPTLGDAMAPHADVAIWAQGTQVESGLTTAAGQFMSPAFNLQVTNGQLDLRFAAADTGNTFALDNLEITPSAAPPASTQLVSGTANGLGTSSAATSGADVSANDSVTSNSANPSTPSASVASDSTSANSVDANATVSSLAAYRRSPLLVAAGSNLTTQAGKAIQLAGRVAGGTAPYGYAWDFGDGDQASGSLTPTYTYRNSGTYTAILTVTDAHNHVAQSSLQVTVQDVAPTVTLSGAPTSSQAGTLIALTGTVASPSPADMSAGFSYLWTVTVNGSPLTSATAKTLNSTSKFGFTPQNAGTYVVSLAATDQFKLTGTTSQTITVTASVPKLVVNAGSAVTAQAGTAISFAGTATGGTAPYTYAWDFGDGDKTTGSLTPAYMYLNSGTYTATLTVTDAQNHVGQASLQVTVQDVAPTPAINDAPVNSPEGTAISLTSTVTSPSPADMTAGFSYAWSVTDNGSTVASATTPNFGFTPQTAGTYVVTLAATDQNHLTGTAISTITVSTVAPLVGINGAPASSLAGTAIALTSNVVSPSSADPVSGFTYAWSVTDNGSTFASAATPNFSFAPTNPGSYAITLKVTDQEDASGTASTAITVTAAGPTANANGPYTGVVGSAIAFTGTATDANASNSGFTYAWNFGDNSTSNVASPSHTYATAGSYTVTFTVTDSGGLSNTATTTATVAAATSNTQSFITTPYDKIPNFGANPNIVSTTSGAWSNPSTWSLGRVPQAGDIVSINPNTTVTYDTVSSAAINTVVIQAGGSLIFRTDISTTLTVVNLLVLQGGALQIGTTSNPVAANVTAQVVIADQPINTTTDPSQYGNGLIGLGTVTMCGAAKTSFVPLAQEAHAGDTTLELAQPATGGQVGDKLVLPDSRGVWDPHNSGYAPEDETIQIQAISSDGMTLTLASPLLYDHLGARDPNGVLDYLPDVGDLTRNVVVHSQNALGTRGYTLFTYRANVDIRYTTFGGLGRTTNAQLDNTTYDTNGNVTHVGTNQGDRNAVYLDHLIGPATTPADGYQYTLLGNAVTCPVEPMNFRWGISLRGSDYGLIQDNVLYNWAGAGLVTEDGSESYNVIAHNFVLDITGTGDRGDGRFAQHDFGFEGTAFWFGGPNNYVHDNVASQVTMYGYNYFVLNDGMVTIPTYQGADPSAGGSQATALNGHTIPVLQFANNEAYGSLTTGLTIWGIGVGGSVTPYPIGQSVVKNFTVWNQSRYGLYGYGTNNFLFDGFVARGDATLLNNSYIGTTGMFFSDYMTQNTTVINADIEGEQMGIVTPYKVGDTRATRQTAQTFTVQNSYLRNYYNIFVATMWADTGGGLALSPRQVLLNNDRFASVLSQDRSGDPQLDIWMDYRTDEPNENLVQPDQVLVYNYNQVQGDNFEVYYAQQAPSFVLPVTVGGWIGSPVAGLTNAEAWAQDGVAIAGAVLPSTATTQARISGYVNPIPAG